MAVQGPSALSPYPPYQQKNILPCTVFKPKPWNTVSKSLHHCVGCSTANTPTFIEGTEPKPKSILPDYIHEIPENSVSEEIRSLCKEGKFQDALDIFHMWRKRQGIRLDRETYAVLLQGCCIIKSVEESRRVYRHMVESGIEVAASLGTTLVVMYCKNGKLLDARQVFTKLPERGLMSWNAIIAGYVKHGRSDEALRVFCEMLEEGEGMDGYTISSILRACAAKFDVSVGQQVHGCAVRMGFQNNVYVGSALVDMYAKCERVEDARQIFDKMSERNVVSWNAMIAGYAQHGCGEEALRLFWDMQVAGVKADNFTLATVLRICAGLASLGQGKQVHGVVIRFEFELDIVLGSALVDLYSKWGRVEDALQVFDKMLERNIISWNAMIAGYGSHGRGKDAIRIFEKMQAEGIKPNHTSLSTILSACSYSGLVNEGWQYFSCMRQDYALTPRVTHYACMVEIICRSGCLDDAYYFIKKSPIKPNAYMWGALLRACRVHVNMALGELAAKHLFELEPNNIGNYLVMLDIYVAGGKRDHAARLKEMMNDRGLNQVPECSWIELKEWVHKFFVGDRLHPQTAAIYALWRKLTIQIKEAGYVPRPSFVLSDIEQQQEEFACYHSEKLAIAFGLLSIPPPKPFQIFQNHSICADCHNAAKFISKVVGREIVVRDSRCFHHFKDGLCSCGDYW